MSLEVGAVYEGKVTGITSFGAFVSLPERHSGLVHISEVANTYVRDINQFLQIGQDVRVRILSINDDGKINLSIKKAQGPEDQKPEPSRQGEPYHNRTPRSVEHARREETPVRPENGVFQEAAEPGSDADFEAKLKKFMKESDSRIADNRIYAEHRQKNRRR